MTAPGKSLKAILAETQRNQAAAADPMASVWVSANAGTGKTHVLTMRVLRLLLAGTAPERILCLTYTKAAAAEMSKRVFDELAKWVTADDEVLQEILGELLECPPNADEMLRARQLFALAIETPGGLKVQTIHAFCEQLLQRFPLEAGVPPHFTILDEETARALQRQAIDDMLGKATGKRPGALGKALTTAITFVVDDTFDAVLRDALRQREWLEFVARPLVAQPLVAPSPGDGDLAQAEADYRRILGLGSGDDAASLDIEMASVISASRMSIAIEVLRGGKKTDADLADALAAAKTAESDGAKLTALRAAFLTKDGGARADTRFVTKAIREAEPGLTDKLVRARDKFAGLHEKRQLLTLIEATMALLRLAGDVMQRYADAKARRAALDFDDLLARAANLLGAAQSAEWVLYKLDGGLDHILVDEAQDTSPVQWSVIQALAGEFFAGSGAREDVRTLFAVGDEKQSIYSFQGAAPKMFAKMGERFAELAVDAGRDWQRIPLTLSFRTVTPVLEAVDAVFADREKLPGLTTDEAAIRHNVFREGQAGLVEIWPTERPQDLEPGEVWAPLTDGSAATPVARLATRIADRIKRWLDDGEMLQSENRPVRAGDILVLLRKRRPFAGPMVTALKARGIPVAGADRLMLSDQIAVRDLVALGDFLVLPEDDLSLACVLKSPLFGLDDDHLLKLAHNDKPQLWSALLDCARRDEDFAEAAETLKRWRARADFIPPYEFFAGLLDRDKGRERLLARLGPEAADPIDEFMNLALQFDDGAPPSLQAFLDWLRGSDRQIKRDMEHGRDEVRVMTVHGAKGLEAPIVFLPDTCSARSGAPPGALLQIDSLARPAGEAAPSPLIWPVKGSSKLSAVAKAKQAAAANDTEERNRLLYVAMTRARDRLYVAGFEGAKGRDKGCWYDLIFEGLNETLEKVTEGDGTQVWRAAAPQEVASEKPSSGIVTAPDPLKLPDWARKKAPREPTLTIPLAPSLLAPLESDDMGEPIEPKTSDAGAQPVLRPKALGDGNRFLRGTLSHALLEHLPSVPRQSWERAAKAFVERRGSSLPAKTRASIVSETLSVLRAPQFAPLFGPQSQAEVPIVAEIAPKDGKGQTLRITGQIDRLAMIDDEILIVDYKTNRPPPHEPEDVAQAYLLQLAAYRLAVSKAFAGRKVRAAILWTDGVRIMEIPGELLDFHQQRLWQPGSRDLDG